MAKTIENNIEKPNWETMVTAYRIYQMLKDCRRKNQYYKDTLKLQPL